MNTFCDIFVKSENKENHEISRDAYENAKIRLHYCITASDVSGDLCQILILKNKIDKTVFNLKTPT